MQECMESKKMFQEFEPGQVQMLDPYCVNAFEKETINPEYEFEEYYIIIQLKNEQLSLKICNVLYQKHFDNSLLEFIQYLTDEGIETFISKSKNKVEIFFSKFVVVYIG